MIRFSTLVCVTFGLGGSALPAQKPVVTTHCERIAWPERSVIAGTLLPEERLDLKARVTGYLAEIWVDIGSRVKRGDPLAKLSVPDLEAAMGKAEAGVEQAEAAVGDAKGALLVAEANVKKATADLAICAAEQRLAQIVATRKRALLEKRGATPAEVDEAEGRLAMAKARGDAAQAEIEGLRAKVSAARLAIKSAEASKASADAGLALARAMVKFATFVCPLASAIVTARKVDPGALVERDKTIVLSLARVDKLRVEIPVPERTARGVVAGTPVDLRFDADGSTMHAKVSRTAGSLTAASVLWVQIDINNTDGKLLPGMYVHATLLHRKDDGVLTLSADAVRHDKKGAVWVWIVVDGRAKKVVVTTGRDSGTRLEVKSGLEGGEEVIVGGDVGEGDAVKIMRQNVGVPK